MSVEAHGTARAIATAAFDAALGEPGGREVLRDLMDEVLDGDDAMLVIYALAQLVGMVCIEHAVQTVPEDTPQEEVIAAARDWFRRFLQRDAEYDALRTL